MEQLSRGHRRDSGRRPGPGLLKPTLAAPSANGVGPRPPGPRRICQCPPRAGPLFLEAGCSLIFQFWLLVCC